MWIFWHKSELYEINPFECYVFGKVCEKTSFRNLWSTHCELRYLNAPFQELELWKNAQDCFCVLATANSWFNHHRTVETLEKTPLRICGARDTCINSRSMISRFQKSAGLPLISKIFQTVISIDLKVVLTSPKMNHLQTILKGKSIRMVRSPFREQRTKTDMDSQRNGTRNIDLDCHLSKCPMLNNKRQSMRCAVPLLILAPCPHR